MQQFNALHIDICDLTHPMISLMNHTGDDIEQVIPVTATQLRGANDQPQLSGLRPYTAYALRTVIALKCCMV